MNSIVEDVRFGLRSLRRAPGFAAVVVLTLGLGIAAATLVFSIVNAALYRLYDRYPAPDRLALLVEVNRRASASALASAADVADWKRGSRSFEYIGGMEARRVTASFGPEPQSLVRVAVTSDVFPMLGAGMIAGRAFVADDYRADAVPVVVLGHAFWQQQLGGRPGVVGQTLVIDGRPHSIVGVARKDVSLLAFFGREPDVLTVLPLPGDGDRAKRGVFAIARLKPGVTPGRAEEEIRLLMASIAAGDPAARGWEVTVRKARGIDVNGEAAFVVVLAAGVVFVLLMVCVNAANLLLIRATGRARELATRLAVGAGRLRLVRQLLTETLVLGVAGNLAGVFLAYWACRGIARMLAQSNLALLDLSPDARTFAFAGLISLVSALAAGLLPAVRASGGSVTETLKGGVTSMGRLSPGRLRGLLVATEVALSLVLLVGSGLVLRGVVNLRHNDPGFAPDGLSFVSVALPGDRYAREAKRVSYVEDALTRLDGLPAVESAATSFLPMTGAELPPQPFGVEGLDTGDASPAAGLMSVSPRFFRTMRVPIKAGRTFTNDDRAGNLPVAIVNEVLVRRWLAGRTPIGLRITLGSETRTIVGVVGDVRNFHLNANPAPTLYVPYGQRPSPSVAFVLRSAGDDQARTVRAARSGLAVIDRALVVRGGRPFTDVIAESLGGFDMTTVIVSVLGIVSLGLAAIGIYSAVAFSVSRRTREIGVRVALGAGPGRLARDVVAEGLRLAAAGTVPGLLLSLAVGKALSAKLHRVSAIDPLVLGAAVGVVLLTVATASYLPARRAVRVDPMVATRGE